VQRRIADIAGLAVKMVRSGGDIGIVRRIIPTQERMISEKLIRIVLKGQWVCMQEGEKIRNERARLKVPHKFFASRSAYGWPTAMPANRPPRSEKPGLEAVC